MSYSAQCDLADRVRQECVKAALAAYESASISGLCAEGAFEAAISAIRMLDVKAIAGECRPSEADSDS